MERGEQGVYYVRIIGDERKVFCNCHLMEKTGIGCAHIFKVLKCLGMSMWKGIHERWRVDEEEAMNQKMKARHQLPRGPAKITRRNPIK